MHPNVRRLLWFNFLLDLRLYGPFAIIYYAEVSGSYTVGMAVFATTQVTSALLEVPTGIASDRLGRRLTLIWGAAASVLAVFSYAVAPALGVAAAATLLLGGALEGLARALFSGNNTALLYDSLAEDGDEQNYHHHFGRLGTALQLGLASGALLGSIAGIWSLNLVFWLSVLPQLTGFGISLGFREPRRSQAQERTSFAHLATAFRHLARSPRLRWLTLAQSISFGFGEASFQFVGAFFRNLWPLWAIGLLRTAAHGMAATGFWWAGRVIDRFQHYRVLIFGSVVGNGATATGLLLANIASPLIMVAPSLLYGVSQTAKNHLLQQGFTDEQRATLGSLVAFAGSLLFGVVAIGAGALADAIGPRDTLLWMLAIQVWVIPIYVGLFRSQS